MTLSLAYSQSDKRHIFTALGFFALAIFSQYSGLDLAIASVIYQFDNQHFATDNVVLDRVFHHDGRYLVGGVMLTLIIMTLVGVRKNSLLRPYLRFSSYMLSASLLCILAIAMLKHLTTLPCPWDTQTFGGTRAYVGWFSMFAANLPVGNCFPSGHASGGYALLSLYFAGSRMLPATPKFSRYWLLVPGILIGGAFGVAQQLRGAHYLSHDFTTIGLCWLLCAITSYLFLPRGNQNKARQPTARLALQES